MGFYLKFAMQNIRKNMQMIVPFIFTAILLVVMYYNVININASDTTGGGNLATVMFAMAILLGIFSLVFLIYTNSFLTKRRKKEFGLYNILGLEKKHISKIIWLENTIIGTVSIVAGLILGIIFSRLIISLLYSIMNFNLRYTFEINMPAIFITALLFTAIFMLLGVFSTISIYKTNAVDLLSANKKADNMPNSNVLTLILGVGLLGVGYYLALSANEVFEVLQIFLIAALFVGAGTYFVFSSISSYILIAMKQNKKLFLKPENFIAISGLIHRIQKNAMGLTAICVLSTGIILMLSTTSSLYMGFDDLLSFRYPYDVQITVVTTEDLAYNETMQFSENVQANFEDVTNYKMYSHFEFWISLSETDERYATGTDGTFNFNYDGLIDSHLVGATNLSTYNTLTNSELSLNDGQVLTSNVPNDSIELANKRYEIAVKDDSFADAMPDYNVFPGTYIVVMTDSDFDNFYARSGQQIMKHSIVFDLPPNAITTTADIQTFVSENRGSFQSVGVQFKENNRDNLYSTYGTLFFVGIFLGLLFIVSISVIIYYKQLTEGYEDKENFVIMKKVGLDDKLAKRSINMQIIMVFMLPILMACIHIAFAFKALVLIMRFFALTNVSLFVSCTLAVMGIFVGVYFLVYYLTSKVYVGIVNS
ncbi:MAG: hypothetical protein ATN35_10045 [Epulopiscium sp. Nele67-Bin004]|nr:MAG: hypothetical protein ATN35_10045 [Epulopiscium sp. Nele67-Bin004]